MGSRRMTILIAAIVIAAVAGVATYRYLSTVQERANKKARLVPVFRVDKTIARGTPGKTAIDKGLIKQVQIREQDRPVTAIEDPAAINGLVAVVDLPAGIFLVQGLFVSPTIAQQKLSTLLQPGTVAITLSADGVKAAGNNIVPGDLVDILVTVQSLKPDGTVVPNSQREQFLYQNVKVLAIGASLAPQPGQTTAPGAASGFFTFAVPPIAAEKLIFASQGLASTGGASAAGGGGGGGGGAAVSNIYLILVPPGNPITAIPPIDSTTVLTGPLTPCLEAPGAPPDCSTKQG